MPLNPRVWLEQHQVREATEYTEFSKALTLIKSRNCCTASCGYEAINDLLSRLEKK